MSRLPLMNERELRLPRQVYRLRIFGLALGFVCIGTVFFERGASPAAWALLIAHGLVWPHVAWMLARASADPHRAQRARRHARRDGGRTGPRAEPAADRDPSRGEHRAGTEPAGRLGGPARRVVADRRAVAAGRRDRPAHADVCPPRPCATGADPG